MNTLILAHYYVPSQVKKLAHFVGDSLDLARKAVSANPDRIIFAGVKFMAETAKIMLPETEVVLPDQQSTCSLVEQTNIDKLRKWRESYPDHLLVSYINCSAEQKALSDWIVTSANVVPIVKYLISKGNKILFANDRNMGIYLKKERGLDMVIWEDAVCEVHDKIKEKEIIIEFNKEFYKTKFLLAHPEAVLPVLRRADFIGSTKKMLEYIEDVDDTDAIFFIATEKGLVDDMKEMKPKLDIRCAPTYDGCKCSICPYMKLNTLEAIKCTLAGTCGYKIDYLSKELIEQARKPIERMLDF